MSYLAQKLVPSRIILVGTVDGVYDCDPLTTSSAQRIPYITPNTYEIIKSKLGASYGPDVTGGMLSKIKDMVTLIRHGMTQRVHLISGEQEDILTHVLLDADYMSGTIIEQ